MLASCTEPARLVEGPSSEIVAPVSNDCFAGSEFDCDAQRMEDDCSGESEAAVIWVAASWFDLDDSVVRVEPQCCECDDGAGLCGGDDVETRVVHGALTERSVGVDAQLILRERGSEGADALWQFVGAELADSVPVGNERLGHVVGSDRATHCWSTGRSREEPSVFEELQELGLVDSTPDPELDLLDTVRCVATRSFGPIQRTAGCLQPNRPGPYDEVAHSRPVEHRQCLRRTMVD